MVTAAAERYMQFAWDQGNAGGSTLGAPLTQLVGFLPIGLVLEAAKALEILPIAGTALGPMFLRQSRPRDPRVTSQGTAKVQPQTEATAKIRPVSLC